MRLPGRTTATALGVCAIASLVACGAGEPARVVGDEITIQAPSAPGATTTIPLLGIQRGAGRPVAVVLAHMLGSSQNAWILLVDELVSEGFQVVTFDFRGHGISGGGRDPALAPLDLAAAVQATRSLGATKVFVVGASMGGTAALAVAAEQDLAGVVAVSAPSSIDGLDVSEAVARLDEPSLFIVAENDQERYTSSAQRMAGSAPPPKRLQVIDGSAGHGSDLLLEEATRQRVTQLILDFLIANRE